MLWLRADETVVHYEIFLTIVNTLQLRINTRDMLERYNVLGKKINKYLQMVMRDHLKPQDKNEKSLLLRIILRQVLLPSASNEVVLTPTTVWQQATSTRQPESSIQFLASGFWFLDLRF